MSKIKFVLTKDTISSMAHNMYSETSYWMNEWSSTGYCEFILTFGLLFGGIKKRINSRLLDYIIHQQLFFFMTAIHGYIPLWCQKVCQATDKELRLKTKIRTLYVVLCIFSVFKSWTHVPLCCLYFELFRFYYRLKCEVICVLVFYVCLHWYKLSFGLCFFPSNFHSFPLTFCFGLSSCL